MTYEEGIPCSIFSKDALNIDHFSNFINKQIFRMFRFKYRVFLRGFLTGHWTILCYKAIICIFNTLNVIWIWSIFRNNVLKIDFLMCTRKIFSSNWKIKSSYKLWLLFQNIYTHLIYEIKFNVSVKNREGNPFFIFINNVLNMKTIFMPPEWNSWASTFCSVCLSVTLWQKSHKPWP